MRIEEEEGAADILYGIDDNISQIVQFINKTNCSYNVYADSRGPSFVIRFQGIIDAYIALRKRGVSIRFVTDITKENIDDCKELIKFVELRHVEGVKGIVRINEREYQCNLAIQESKSASLLIRSTIKEIVRQQQNIFDTLWSMAIPAIQRIEEIEEHGGGTEDSEVQVKEEQLTPSASIIMPEPIQKIIDDLVILKGWMNDNSDDDNDNKKDSGKWFENKQKIESPSSSSSSFGSINEILPTESSASKDSSSISESVMNSYKKNNNNKKHLHNPKPQLQCHFCKLVFHSGNQRKVHEEAWHSGNNLAVK